MTGTSRQPPGLLLSVIRPTLGVGKCTREDDRRSALAEVKVMIEDFR